MEGGKVKGPPQLHMYLLEVGFVEVLQVKIKKKTVSKGSFINKYKK
jgi:hypothetical protein